MIIMQYVTSDYYRGGGKPGYSGRLKTCQLTNVSVCAAIPQKQLVMCHRKQLQTDELLTFNTHPLAAYQDFI